MIISVLYGKSELRDLEVSPNMKLGKLITGSFAGIDKCVIYNEKGEELDKEKTFSDYKIMNGGMLRIRGGHQ